MSYVFSRKLGLIWFWDSLHGLLRGWKLDIARNILRFAFSVGKGVEGQLLDEAVECFLGSTSHACMFMPIDG